MEISLAVIAELFSLPSGQDQCLRYPFWAWAYKVPTLPHRKVQLSAGKEEGSSLTPSQVSVLHSALKKAACVMVG